MCAARKPELQIIAALCCLLFGASAVAQQRSPVESTADNQPLARIEHSAPAIALFAEEVGRVEPERALARMVLVLSPSPEKQQALLQFLDAKPKLPKHRYELFLTGAEREWAADYLEQADLQSRPMLGIHVGSGGTKNLAQRRWPLENYIELVRRLTSLPAMRYAESWRPATGCPARCE